MSEDKQPKEFTFNVPDSVPKKSHLVRFKDAELDIKKPPTLRKKVGLKPGFTLMGWYALADKLNVKPINGLIPLSEIKKHNQIDDCWTIFRGKVYDITRYLEYHPGGIDILMSGAGKDCTSLYDKYHQWVNGEGILNKVFLGYPLATKSQYGIVQCKKIIDVTNDVKSFIFATYKPIFFVPGQNATFSFRMGDLSNSRTWTLTGSPANKSLEVTIKRKEGGLVSNWMLDKLKVGSQLNLVDVDGRFGIFMMKELPKKILFISGGVGITPFISMLRRLYELSLSNLDIIMVHSEATEIPFHQELSKISKKLKNLKIFFTLTKSEQKFENEERICYSKGRVSKEFFEQTIVDYKEREIFLCGPDFFMDTCILAFQALGKEDIHVESFDY
eukprot:gene7587-11910_t